MTYNGIVCMMATSEVPVKFGEGNGRSRRGEGMRELISQETIRSIPYLSNFSAETKATFLSSQIAKHLFHLGFQFNSIQCVRMHVIDRNFLSLPSSNIHGPQATSAVSCPLAHSNFNSHFKLAH